jgi:hypothetical protein
MTFNNAERQQEELQLQNFKYAINAFAEQTINKKIMDKYLTDFNKTKNLQNSIKALLLQDANISRDVKSLANKIRDNILNPKDTSVKKISEALEGYSQIKETSLNPYTAAIDNVISTIADINKPENVVLNELSNAVDKKKEFAINLIDSHVSLLKEIEQKVSDKLNARVTLGLFDPPSTVGHRGPVEEMLNELSGRKLDSNTGFLSGNNILNQAFHLPGSEGNAARQAWLASRGLDAKGKPVKGGKRTRRRRYKKKRTRRSC